MIEELKLYSYSQEKERLYTKINELINEINSLKDRVKILEKKGGV